MEALGSTEEIKLTNQEAQIVSELDSRQFGFIKLNEPQHANKKTIVQKTIKCLERIILKAVNSSDSDVVYDGLKAFREAASSVSNGLTSKNGTFSSVGGSSTNNGMGRSLDPLLSDTSSLMATIKEEPTSGDDTNTLLSTTLVPTTSTSDAFLISDGNATTTTIIGDGGMESAASTTTSALSFINTLTTDSDLSSTNINNNNNNTSIAQLLSGNNDNESSLLRTTSLSNTPPSSNEDSQAVNPETYCKLGHLHLLLEDFPKAMSAYQKYFNLCHDNYWKNATFLYGQGLVYFYFHAFQWAIKSFQQVLYIDPSFSRTNEVNLRLGLMFKVQNDFDSALKHFKLALLDSGPCTFSKIEIRFHEAHLYEHQGKHKIAQDIYDKLLKEQDVGALRADIYRQLGWMHHTVESLGEKRERQEKAVTLLQKSIEANPKSGQSLYLLGRCLASLGRIHEAFLAYRNSVDKSEGNADTWCSIGVLYQQQNQPIDALQAYICAVQFDKTHVAAWTNLGTLYESVNQPRDALTCYLNACKYDTSHNPNPNLGPRTQFLQQQLAAAPMPSLARPKTLLTIEEAWNFPVSTDMNQRGGTPRSGSTAGGASFSKQQQSQHAPPPYQQHQDTKRFKPDVADLARPQYYLSSQQIQMLHYLQTNTASLTLSQQQQLQHLQHNYRLMQQHQLQLRQQQQQQQQLQQSGQIGAPAYGSPVRGQTSYNAPSAGVVNGSAAAPVAGGGQVGYMPARPHTPQQQYTSTNTAVPYTNGTQYPQQQQMGQQQGTTTNGGTYYTGEQSTGSQGHQSSLSGGSSTLPDHTTLSDQELQELISQKELTESFAEDLLNRLAKGENVMDELNKGDLDHTALPNTQFSSSALPDTTPRLDSKIVKQEIDLKPENIIDNTDLEGLPPDIKSENNTEIEVNPNMSSAEIMNACRTRGALSRNLCMLGDNHPPPSPPEPPSIRLNKDQLVPPTASVLLENKKLAFSPQLQEFCLKHPIAVVRGLASALKMDLGLFSTKTLVQTNPEHTIEVRTQAFQPADTNLDPNNPERVVWPCYSHRSHTTISKYAQYQANSFQESLKEEQDRVAAGGQRTDESKNKKKMLNKMIKFGTNVDLSDDKKWRLQLQELQKLPAFSRVVSAGNMLSHVGHPILGMNTVQLYMKVPGSRTPGHQENNNFCSININIGPGDCEWFAVPDAYWGVIANLCDKNGSNYLHGSWWPDLNELFEENVPVYRFLQKPGDMVWVNSGCVHWVQAVGWCNNIAWNVGPLTARQYQLALERYEWNKLQRFKSIVPMLHLTWNLARNIKVSDVKLFELIKVCLMRSLRQICLSLDFVKMCGLEPKFHGRARNEASHYCGVCDLEVFNVLFVREIDRRHVVHCVDCARRISQTLDGFVVLEEFHLDDLTDVYDQFVLHSIQSQSIPGQAPTPPPSAITPTPSALVT